MAAFQYTALNPKGQNAKGVIEADSERQARQFLRERELIPLEVRPLAKKQQSHIKDKLSAQDLALITRQLATLLSAGIPVEEALRGVSEQADKDKVRGLIIGVRAKVIEGYGLAEAMSEFPHSFPELYRATVSAGEQTGHLDLVLNKLADYTENQQQTKQKIQQALIYPVLMIVVSTLIIGFLLAYIVPKIIEVFSSSGQELPLMTKILISLSDFIKQDGLYIVGLLALSIFAFKKSLANIKIKRYWHQFLLKIPLFSYLLKSTNVARYIHTFSILFAAGVNVLETMKVSASVLNNEIMKEAFNKAAIQVKEGSSISSALKRTEFLSPMTIHLITSGEKSGQLSSMMERAASHLDLEVKRIIDTGLTLLEPLIILFMGAFVLFIVLATLLPIFSMEQLVT
ncbi:MAG: type II secretion system inner membrane protein GspF [Proteobacteria bacterium]|nr:type II secretion system inner membrane protein GspF [Pseudomonadota bacterium]